MRTLAYFLAATVSLPTAANAAVTLSGVTFDEANGTPYSEQVHVVSGNPVTGTNLALTTNPSGIDVAVSSTDTLHATDGGGFAFVSGTGAPSANLGFSNITIDPLSPWSYFTAMKFNLSPLADQANQLDWRFDAVVNLLGGGILNFDDIEFIITPGRYDVVAGIFLGDQQFIDSITLSGLEGRTSAKGQTPAGAYAAYNFDSIRQISFNAVEASEIPNPQGAVPEPGTWMTMILGFGFVGSMLRRRKSASTSRRVRFA